jgi:hypothetical protein
MEEGGGRTNYYRVSVAGKEAFTSEGAVSRDQNLTHVAITSNSLKEILNILAKIGK